MLRHRLNSYSQSLPNSSHEILKLNLLVKDFSLFESTLFLDMIIHFGDVKTNATWFIYMWHLRCKRFSTKANIIFAGGNYCQSSPITNQICTFFNLFKDCISSLTIVLIKLTYAILITRQFYSIEVPPKHILDINNMESVTSNLDWIIIVILYYSYSFYPCFFLFGIQWT